MNFIHILEKQQEIQVNKMKTTVLKANTNLATKIANELLSLTTQSGKPTFFKIDVENGFEIFGKTRNSAGEIVKEVVFRFTVQPTPRIDYNENLITID
jgi:hypothetical protein